MRTCYVLTTTIFKRVVADKIRGITRILEGDTVRISGQCEDFVGSSPRGLTPASYLNYSQSDDVSTQNGPGTI